MIRLCSALALLCCSSLFATVSVAQKPTPANKNSESAELLNLARKIDQQNIKIDLLSQQILRLQQEIEHPKTTAASETPHHGANTPAPVSAPAEAAGNAHVVAKGETLTSIARMHKVSISELQKLNHIEDDRKLQIGQTLIVPGGSASPSPSASPNE